MTRQCLFLRHGEFLTGVAGISGRLRCAGDGVVGGGGVVPAGDVLLAGEEGVVLGVEDFLEGLFEVGLEASGRLLAHRGARISCGVFGTRTMGLKRATRVLPLRVSAGAVDLNRCLGDLFGLAGRWGAGIISGTFGEGRAIREDAVGGAKPD